MDGLYVILAILVLGTPVLAVLGLIGFVRSIGLAEQVERLARRLAETEARLASLRQADGPAPMAEPVAPPPVEVPTPPVERPPEVIAEPPQSEPPPIEAPPGPRRLEETLGTRWAVWVGGLALAFGGLFLVRYGIENGYLGPVTRVVLGFAFGLGLIGLGERLLKRGYEARVANLVAADIPSILAAAGTSTLFVSAFAAHALYDLIGPVPAFSLLIAIALLTISLSLRHAPWLSGLGLLGGTLAPLLVQSGQVSLWPVVLLSIVLTSTAYTLARFRGWRFVAWLGFAGHVFWALLMVAYQVVRSPDAASALPVGVEILALLVLSIALGVVTTDFALVPNEPSANDRRVAITGSVAAALLAAALTSLGGIALVPLLVATLAILIAAAAAVAFPALRWNAIVAAFLAIVVVAAYDAIEPVLFEGQMVDPRTIGVIRDRSIDQLLITALGFALFFGLGGAIATFRRPDARLAMAASATPVALLAVTSLRFRLLGDELSFGFAALALAAGLAIVAETLLRRAASEEATAFGAAGFYAAASAASLGLALGFLLPSGGLPLGLALAGLGIAAVYTRRRLAALRVAAGAAALLVIAVLLRAPGIAIPGPGAPPFVNALLTGIGLPGVAFAAAAFLLRSGGFGRVIILLETLATLFLLLYLWLALHHAWAGSLASDAFARDELGLTALMLLVAGYAFRRLAHVIESIVYRFTADAALVVAGGVAVLALAAHPWLDATAVQGGNLVNDLALAYLAPALGFLCVFLRERDTPERGPIARAAEIATHVLALAYAIAEVSLLYRGPTLESAFTQAELYTYSALGLVYGIVLLGLGLVLERRSLRIASAVVLVVTVLKAFIIDMSGLEGLLRAVSFIGLGAVLIGIGLVYQRLLTRPASDA